MAKKLLHTTSAEPTEVEELSGRVLGIIGAYGMGTALDTCDLNVSTAPIAPPRARPRARPGRHQGRRVPRRALRRGEAGGAAAA